MSRLSNEAARELFAQSKGGKKITADPKFLDNLIKRSNGGVSPAPKVSAPKKDSRPAEGPKKHKYGAVEEIDEATGKKAKSKLQAKHESEYRLMLKEGLIATYCPEVEISLVSPRTGGKHTYKCDHLIVHWDGSLEYIDSKGAITPEFRKKANWMERQFLPKMAENGVKVTFMARYAKETHTYQSKPKKGK